MIKAEYIDHLGSDLTVVNAARVSFDKESELEYNLASDDAGGLKGGDKRLISYLARHNHFTPFTHAMITLRETVPIFLARQRFKHYIGFTYSEVSRRYVDTPPEFYVPDEWRERAVDKKQGSGGKHEGYVLYEYQKDDDKTIPYKYQCGVDTPMGEAYSRLVDHAETLYDAAIYAGIAPEMARMLLPQATMTSYYVTGSLAAFARAYKLRIAEDSQYEIQLLAKQWDEIISPLYPESWKVLKE